MFRFCFKFTILQFVLLFIVNSVNSQVLFNTYLTRSNDTIFILPAVGYILYPDEKGSLPSDSLTAVFQENLKSSLEKVKILNVKNLADSLELSDSLKSYFAKSIEKIRILDEDIFSKIPVGLSFNSMIEKIPGRYFGVLLYQGYVQGELGKKMIKSISIGLATAALTGGLFAIMPVVVDPYLETHLLIIDKQNNKFLFYKHQHYMGNPLDKEKLDRKIQKIFQELVTGN